MVEHEGRPPRIAVLWAHMSGYFHASLRALVNEGAEVFVVHRAASATAPFDSDSVTAGLRVETWSDAPDVAAIRRALDAFDPDAVIVCSWNVGGYRKIARGLHGCTLRILAMDNQWLATPKQWAGVAVSRFVVRPCFDAVFLPGDTQATFARKLGFTTEQTMSGLYTCDHPRFAAVAERRGDALPPEAFLFVGRLVPDKGIDVLAGAYERYRTEVADPWPLLVAGTGPQQDLLEGVKGVETLGFVQPSDLPEVFERAGCLVLPSRFEPWATVIHEAAAVGLPVVCTRACGASTRLVLDGYNGVIVSPGNVDALTGALGRIHGLSDQERRAMGVASTSLARQHTPERWARTLLDRIPDFRAHVGLPPTP